MKWHPNRHDTRHGNRKDDKSGMSASKDMILAIIAIMMAILTIKR